MTDLRRNLEIIQEKIQKASTRAGRLSAVTIVAATKTQPIDTLHALYDLGLRDFGENRVQELLRKKDLLPPDIRWHMIGHLQTNKARQIAGFIDCIHSIDSIETAEALSHRAAAGRRIPTLIEVNISGEPTKEGIAPDEASLLAEAITKCEGVSLQGLMGMASYEEDTEKVRSQFQTLKRLRDEIAERHPEFQHFKELSMGMSNDYEVAIESGATMIRIGSALFGERNYS